MRVKGRIENSGQRKVANESRSVHLHEPRLIRSTFPDNDSVMAVDTKYFASCGTGFLCVQQASCYSSVERKHSLSKNNLRCVYQLLCKRK